MHYIIVQSGKEVGTEKVLWKGTNEEDAYHEFARILMKEYGKDYCFDIKHIEDVSLLYDMFIIDKDHHGVIEMKDYFRVVRRSCRKFAKWHGDPKHIFYVHWYKDFDENRHWHESLSIQIEDDDAEQIRIEMQ